MTEAEQTNKPQPPPAQGVRHNWEAIPEKVSAELEGWLGSPVVSAISQPGGFSPGVAARLRTADGHGYFAKAIGPQPNPDSPAIHRREAQVAALMPPSAPVPRLLWSYDDPSTGWVVLLFEEIVDGQHPAQPWQTDELARVLDAMAVLSDTLTPSSPPSDAMGNAGFVFESQLCGWQKLRDARPTNLDDWSLRHLEQLAQVEFSAKQVVAGDTLLHLDIRADNMLLTPDKVWFVDWPHACVGAAWIDVLCFAPSVTMQGGPAPETIVARHPTLVSADPDAVTAAVVSIAGYFTHRALQPPPPGLPTVRAFQAAQGVVAREWVAQRTGWT